MGDCGTHGRLLFRSAGRPPYGIIWAFAHCARTRRLRLLISPVLGNFGLARKSGGMPHAC